jgi:hypothetical protein
MNDGGPWSDGVPDGIDQALQLASLSIDLRVPLALL